MSTFKIQPSFSILQPYKSTYLYIQKHRSDNHLQLVSVYYFKSLRVPAQRACASYRQLHYGEMKIK